MADGIKQSPFLTMGSELKLLEPRRSLLSPLLPTAPHMQSEDRNLTLPSLGCDVRSFWKDAEVQPILICSLLRAAQVTALERKRTQKPALQINKRINKIK